MPMIALMDIVAATIYKKQMYWLLMLLTFIGLKRLPFEISSLFWTRLKEKWSLFQGEGFQVQRLFIKSIAKRCQFEENNICLCIVYCRIEYCNKHLRDVQWAICPSDWLSHAGRRYSIEKRYKQSFFSRDLHWTLCAVPVTRTSLGELIFLFPPEWEVEWTDGLSGGEEIRLGSDCVEGKTKALHTALTDAWIMKMDWKIKIC